MKISFLKENTAEHIKLNELIQNNSIELNDTKDIDNLIDEIGDSKYVLLGEASHGTHEYYTWRTRISKKLIERKGFSFIAVEGDWPDCYCVNRYIKNYSDSDKTALDVIHKFNRWPTWMWANWEVIALVEWIRKHNDINKNRRKIGFYGLDVYSLWESMEAIIKYLDKEDPKAKQLAIKAYGCFEPYSDDEGQSYARATYMLPVSCEDEVIDLLVEIRKKIIQYDSDPEAVLSTEQNANIIVNAERYYRTMVKAGPESWNIRDTHMVDTLNRLMKFHGTDAKAIVWEHNTHIGDARATDMADEGTINVGQLVREQHSKEGVFVVGFGSYKGTVIAGREWGDAMRAIHVPEAGAGSWENILHQVDAKNRIIFLNRDEMKMKLANRRFGHRAIGVVYRPEFEYPGNYVPSLMTERYDAFIYVDETTALHPLHIEPHGHQVPETYPFGV